MSNFLKYAEKAKIPIANRAAIASLTSIKDGDGPGSIRVMTNDNHSFSTLENRFCTLKFTPATSLSSNFFTTSSQCDIRIEPVQAVIHDMALEISVQNTDASNTVTPAPLPLWIERIEIYGNNGSDLLQSLYGDQIFLNYGLYSDEQLSHIATVANMNTSFAGTTAIGTSTSITYYVPLPGNFFQQSEGFFLGALEGAITCRIYSRNAVESGTGTLSTDSIKVLLECEQLPQNELVQLHDLHRQSPVMYPLLDCNPFSINQTFSASTQYSLQLSNVTGLVPFVVGGFRSSKSNTSGGYRTFANPGNTATLELIDSAGQNQNGGSTLTIAQLRYLEAPKYWRGKLATNLAVIPISFCKDPMAAVGFGVKQGGYYHDSKDTLRITLSSGFSSGSYTLDLYYHVWRQIVCVGGRLVKMDY